MKRITALIIGIFSIICLVSSCKDDIINTEPGSNRSVKISISDPSDVQIGTYSTANTYENTIASGIILIWRSATAATSYPDYAEYIDVNNIVGNGSASPILPELKNDFVLQNGDRIYVLLNSVVSTIPSDLNENNINTKLTNAYESSFYEFSPTTYFAMSGKISSWSLSNNTCTIERVYAKIGVQLGTAVTDNTGEFILDSVYYSIANFAVLKEILPTTTLSGGKLPSWFAGNCPYYDQDTKLRLIQYNPTNRTDPLYGYIGEFPYSTSTITGNSIPSNVFTNSRAYILITVKTKSGAAPDYKRYYRLDFYNQTTKKFMDIERNKYYLFTINKIRSKGYIYASHADSIPGSNIEYTLTVDSGNCITSNGQYAIVTSADTVTMSSLGPENVGTVKYILPSEIYYLPTNMINQIIITSATPAGSLTLNSPSPAKITDTNQNINLTATSGFTEGVIEFRFGNIIHKMVVKK